MSDHLEVANALLSQTKAEKSSQVKQIPDDKMRGYKAPQWMIGGLPIWPSQEILRCHKETVA